RGDRDARSLRRPRRLRPAGARADRVGLAAAGRPAPGFARHGQPAGVLVVHPGAALLSLAAVRRTARVCDPPLNDQWRATMRVVQAEVLGMCFGVRDALKALQAIDRPEEVTIHGDLVHNEVVLTHLGRRGFGMTREADRQGVPETPAVLITAH